MDVTFAKDTRIHALTRPARARPGTSEFPNHSYQFLAGRLSFSPDTMLEWTESLPTLRVKVVDLVHLRFTRSLLE